MNLLLAALCLAAAPAGQADVAVVCPAEFGQALAPWLAHRGRQGHRMVFVDNRGGPEDIRRGIRRAAEHGSLRYVLLVGDADPVAEKDRAARARSVPVVTVPAKVNIRWGSEPEIATDNWYADLDDDQVPDLAIGRLTADSPGELALIVEKILAYEHANDFGAWRRRVNFVAGVGGFGWLADAVLELGTKQLITGALPAAYASSMTYASWRSAYCPDPRQFSDTTLARLNEGCLFWVYIGHGQRRGLDQLQVPGGRYPILDVGHVSRLECVSGSPIAFFMACYAGAFDGEEDCLAEEILRRPGAPVAVISGTRVTMPYAMAVLGMGLLDECFTHRRETLGEALLQAKRRMVSGPVQGAHRATLDLLASAISPTPDDLAAERMEHVHLFNLLGDPLLRLRHPQAVELRMGKAVEAGEKLQISGTCRIGGHCTLELVTRRDRLTFQPSPRKQFDPSAEALTKLQAVYQRANDPRWMSVELPIEPGDFHVVLDVPGGASGPCHVRAFVEGNDDFALGSADVEVLSGGGKGTMAGGQ